MPLGSADKLCTYLDTPRECATAAAGRTLLNKVRGSCHRDPSGERAAIPLNSPILVPPREQFNNGVIKCARENSMLGVWVVYEDGMAYRA